jgi:hypothetical protein
LEVAAAGDGYGESNLGYGGIPGAAGGKYRCAIHARAWAHYAGGLRVWLEAEDGKPLAEGRIPQLTGGWRRHNPLLAEAKPGFMRFPGGGIVEGKTLPNAYRWKDTVGDIATRKQNWNRWEEVIANPAVKKCKQTYGLGYFECYHVFYRALIR